MSGGNVLLRRKRLLRELNDGVVLDLRRVFVYQRMIQSDCFELFLVAEVVEDAGNLLEEFLGIVSTLLWRHCKIVFFDTRI